MGTQLTRCLWLAVAFFAITTSTFGAEALTLYVATDGNDAWSGRIREANAAKTDGPLATVNGARDAIRKLRESSGERTAVTVLIRGGMYRMSETFVLEPCDSGVTYAASPGETPVLSGGLVIRGWKRGAGNVWQATVPSAAHGKWQFEQLFVNGQRRIRARSPNEGWFTVAGKAPPQVNGRTGKEIPRDRTAFVFHPSEIQSSWPNLNDVNVVVYHSWETSRLRIADVDAENRIVSFTGAAHWPFERWGSGQRYFIENTAEALDTPGEWFLDYQTGIVSYYPLPDEDLRTAEVVAPRLTRLVELKGDVESGKWVEDVSLKGITFCHEDWELEEKGHSDPQAVVTAPAAIMADGARHCTIERCEMSHVGHYAVWFRHACKDNRIVRNRIHDLGIGGVRIGEAGMPASEAVTSSHNRVDNNHIFDGGHVYPAGVGVWVAQSHHNVISHNEVHDFNYSGMSIGWNWNDADNRCHDNVIEFNHVHHVMNGQLNDGGAIYTLGKSPGSVIRNNVFHDVWPYSTFGWGVYLDATTSGYTVENNIVYNILNGGLMKHNGGHENIVRNNVFAFSAQQMLWPCWDQRPNTFERNIVYFTQGMLFIPMAEGRLKQRKSAGESLGTWDNNVFWNPNEPAFQLFRHDFSKWQTLGLDQHSVVADPLFVDVNAYDYRLKPDSPALKLGFQPIDTSNVGLYGDSDWIAEARNVKHPPTELPEPPPPPKPTPIDDGFENTVNGASPDGFTVSGETHKASIRVSSEQAATGRHSLKLRDAAGLQPSWQPHMFYQPHFKDGTVRQCFDIFLTSDVLAFTEWRDDTSYPACIGPNMSFDARGGREAKIGAGGNPIATVPLGQWVHVEIECQLRQPAKGRFAVTIAAPNAASKTVTDIAIPGSEFQELHWLGFVCHGDSDSVFYLDNMKIQQADAASTR